MKALSIVSPNGSRIAEGYKTIEVRSWMPNLEINEYFLIVENNRYLHYENEVDEMGRVVAIAKIKNIRKYIVEDMRDACATLYCSLWI